MAPTSSPKLWRSRFLALGAMLLLLSLQTACTRSKPTPRTTQTINIGNGDELKDLDPHLVTGVPEFHVLMNIFEGLVSKAPRTLQPVPGVAESWTISPDGKTYTFKLRPDAKWSNGDPVTADDFVYSWTRLLTPATAAEYAYQAFYIKNGKAFNSGTLKDASQLGVKAKDPHTLVVELENPTPFFLSLLAHHSLFPVHRASIEKYGTNWTRPGNLVSNGPYILTAWEMNKVITLKRNPNYWDKDHVTIETANFYPVQDLNTEEKMFRSGELDITNEVPLEKLPYWQADKSGAYQQAPYLGTYFYWMNVTKPPLNNKMVRQAIALAIDREKIVKYVTRGGQLPGTVLTPPGTGGYTPTPRLPADSSQIAKARELLAKAGYPDGKGLPPIELLYNTNTAHKKIAETIQEMLKENLGVNIELFNQEWKVYTDSLKTKSYQLARYGWIGDYNDPNTFLDMFTTGNGNNFGGYSNPKYDALIDAAAKERDAKKRLQIFGQAEDVLLDDLPVLPIYIYTRVYLKNPIVQGWDSNIEDIHYLKDVSLNLKGLGR